MIDTTLPTLNRTQFSKQQTGPFTAVPKQFYIGQPGTVDTLLYTTPAPQTVANPVGLNNKARVQFIWVSNTTGSQATITLYLVESGGSSAANRSILTAVPVSANASYGIPCNFILEASGMVRGLQGTATAITVAISGEELVTSA